MDAESQQVEELKAKVAQLEKWNLMTDEQIVMDLKAEIERLKNIIAATEVERDAADKICDNLKETIDALDDHGRAASFIETLRAKEHEIRLLRAELDVLKAMR